MMLRYFSSLNILATIPVRAPTTIPLPIASPTRDAKCLCSAILLVKIEVIYKDWLDKSN